MPRNGAVVVLTALRKRWRQRNAVVSATSHCAAEPRTVSPTLSDWVNSSQRSLSRKRASGVPVRALKLLAQALQRYRRKPLARPRFTAPCVPQCGHCRSSRTQASMAATTSASPSRPVNTASPPPAAAPPSDRQLRRAKREILQHPYQPPVQRERFYQR